MKERSNSPPNLDKYLKKKPRKCMTYADGARYYSMAYWSFVAAAKEAGANILIRQHTFVDLKIFDKYIEQYCVYEPEREEEKMAKRKEVEALQEMVKNGKKKYVRYQEGAELYSVGLHTFESLAKDAGAIRRVKGVVLCNTEKIDAFIETLGEEDY